MLMYRAHATSAYLPTCLLPTPAASIGTAAGTAAVGVGRAWRCDSVLDLPLPILRHRPLKDPMVIHQVRLLCAAEAAHLRRGSGAWERSAEGGEASPLLPLSLAHFPRRRSSALALLCTGAPLHWRLAFCPLASSITQTSLQVCVGVRGAVRCAPVLGCARRCDG
jgi:hypothetical protein